jgi:hypothetical protein
MYFMGLGTRLVLREETVESAAANVCHTVPVGVEDGREGHAAIGLTVMFEKRGRRPVDVILLAQGAAGNTVDLDLDVIVVEGHGLSSSLSA